MNVQFLPEARAELQDAVSYYEGELSGLGLRFCYLASRKEHLGRRNNGNGCGSINYRQICRCCVGGPQYFAPNPAGSSSLRSCF